MPRVARQCPGGHVYHIWNRAAGRLRLFKKDADYLAFERILVQAHERYPIAILDWCLMPNHWHFAVLPARDGQVSEFFRWLTHTHAMRAITHRRVLGMGPLYQGRFKSMPVEQDEHLLTLLAYIQRNPIRAKLVKRPGDWRWCAEAVRQGRKNPVLSREPLVAAKAMPGHKPLPSILADWPVDRPRDWEAWIERSSSEPQTLAIRECIRRGRPLGDPQWTMKTAKRLDLTYTLRPRGRPRTPEIG